MKTIKLIFFLTFSIYLSGSLKAQIVQVDNGSYTNIFPGTDEAGRNSFPSGTPQLSGNALNKPVPTNDWWSRLIKEDFASNLFNYPMTLKTTNEGLVVTYIPWGVIDGVEPIVVGTTGMNATKTTVSDYSDWTVTMNWDDGSHQLDATSGIGMPFIYFEKESDDVAQVEINGGATATVLDEMIVINNARNDADFAIYAPTGSTWTKNGSIYTSALNGNNYWSIAMLPLTAPNASTVAEEYKKYAYVFPTNTNATWTFNEFNSTLRTDFVVETDVKEGVETDMLIGLLPHQWDYLASDSPEPSEYVYSSVRGDIKTLQGNTFSVENTFRGILPTMPYLANYSEGFSPSALDQKIATVENNELSTWTDSYNEGQAMNLLIQTARIADQTGDIEARDKMIATVKERLEDWLTYQSGEVAFLFYYQPDWTALLGYPSGHGQDSNINDHHFHWGYFIHAAAFIEQYEPGWMDQWGDMVNHLVRDAASPNRNDEKFPFLRNFSPFAGHCWANGFATFPGGNDQESTSESMQFNSSLIHWGTITGNDEIRDLGIYLYTTEQTAIEEYWFDVNERNFREEQEYALVSRVWGNSYDNGTFWTSDIEASYCIELYPMHGGSLYLGYDTDYVQKLWDEMKVNTGILSNTDTNPNLWEDVVYKYLSFIDPELAIELYDAYPDRGLKFGVSDAQTYHWLHAMNAMGGLRNDITADYPIAAAFDKDGAKTYVAHNYSDSPITVTYSDGFSLDVPANKMITNREASVSGVISSDFTEAYLEGSVNLTVEIEGEGVTKVEFYDGGVLLGEKIASPFEFELEELSLGAHDVYAKVYEGDNFNLTNTITIQVGDQVAYSGSPTQIPGTIQSGHYDVFEGGNGEGISYSDGTPDNQGTFRSDEYVDAVEVTSEGATIGWTDPEEWLEYTIDVVESGTYDLAIRYASANASGGGPFYLKLNDDRLTENITLSTTGSWSTWATATVNDIELGKGRHVLRVEIIEDEFNLGRMIFTRSGDLSYDIPVANAGDNVVVILPETFASLDGSSTEDFDIPDLIYSWKQVYGPSSITFSDDSAISPDISNLEEGIYKFELTVGDGTHSSSSTVLVIVTESGNTAPTVSITSPSENDAFQEGETVEITASASDTDGSIMSVAFYNDQVKIGEDFTSPYAFSWINGEEGTHTLSVKATDNGGAVSASEEVNIRINQIRLCIETGDEKRSGSESAVFNNGYTSTFETSGTDLIVTFDLLDTDKDSGLIAFLQIESPFSEVQMTKLAGTDRTFQVTLPDQTLGASLNLSCRFAYAGATISTAYIPYIVGDDCQEITPETDATLNAINIDGVSLDGFSSSIFSYEFDLASGTTLVPTVTATANEAAALVTVTPAPSIPGTTTISVTSSDDTVVEIYSIDFVINTPQVSAPTPPSRDEAGVIALFSESYTNVSVDDWRSLESEVITTYEEVSIGSGLVKKYAALDYVIIDIGEENELDLSQMTYVHFDVWTPDASTIGFKLINIDGETNTEQQVDQANSSFREWISYDILLSDFSALPSKENIQKISFTGAQDGSRETLFIDNLYFHSGQVALPPVAPSSYCQTQIQHLFTADAGSVIYLTISNLDATTIYVEMESADDNDLEEFGIEGISGGTVSSLDAPSVGILKRTINWSTPPDEVTMSILWSKDPGGGRWLLSNLSVPFLASCSFDDLIIDVDQVSTDDIICGNLIVMPDATLTIEAGHTLTVTNDLTINGSLIINSGGSLITYDGNNSGNVTVKRNTRYSDGKYSFVGIPVENDGSIVGANLGTVSYSYDETIPYGNDGLARWVNASTTELETGVGYAQAFQQEISFTGIPNDGTITVSGLSHTNLDGNHDEHGWSLVSNPYPAAIAVEKFLLDATNSAVLNGAIYLWDDNGSDTERGDNSDYLTVNSVGEVGGPNGGYFNGYLGSMQGFFVKVSAPASDVSINFTEDMRVGGVNNDASFFRKGKDHSPTVKLAIESKDQGFYNELLIGLKPDASIGIDKHYDATKLIFDTDLQFYSLIGDGKFAIQGLPIESGVTTELAFNLKESTELTLTVKEMIASSDEYFYLYDKVTGLTYDLGEVVPITFSASKGSDQNRFTLTYTNNKVLSSTATVNEPIYRFINNELLVSFRENTHVSGYAVYDLSGKKLNSQSLNSSISELTIPVSNKGINIVRIVTSEGSFMRKVLSF